MYGEFDHQITLDVGGRNSRLLYDAYRRTLSEPVVKRAADRLAGSLEPERTVLLTTGFPITPSNHPETDGPLGAAILAQALGALGAQPVFVVDERTRPAVEAVANELTGSYAIEQIPTTAELAHTAATKPPIVAESLLADHEPAAVIAVEKPGRTADGTYRNMTGEDITAHVSPTDELFTQAAEQSTLTLGIGDGGNEIGMGSIRATVETTIDHGETIGCVTPVDELVVAGVSNWGAYGVVAALSLSVGQNLLHTGAVERQLLASCVDAGAVDGVCGQNVPRVDGIQSDVHEQVVEMLHAMCTRALNQNNE